MRILRDPVKRAAGLGLFRIVGNHVVMCRADMRSDLLDRESASGSVATEHIDIVTDKANRAFGAVVPASAFALRLGTDSVTPFSVCHHAACNFRCASRLAQNQSSRIICDSAIKNDSGAILRFFENAFVLVRFDHVASVIINIESHQNASRQDS
jgi:hypothetical protein